MAGVRLINRWQLGGLWLQCYTVAERIEKRIQCTEFRCLPDDMLIIDFINGIISLINNVTKRADYSIQDNKVYMLRYPQALHSSEKWVLLYFEHPKVICMIM